MRLFVLIHEYDVDGSDEIVGVFSSLKLAQEAQGSGRSCIQEFELDGTESFLACHWLKEKP